VRDVDKMAAVAELDGFPLDRFTPMYCELNSFESVRKFCADVKTFKKSKTIDRLICNAGVYQPSLPYAKWSADGHEQTMQINFLSHFLMISELIEDMMSSPDPRITMVGSVTGNDNTVGGGGVYPIADLKELEGFKAGFSNPVAMADGYGFIGAKAYKDSKLSLMMLGNVLHAKYHKLTGIAFSTMYPGCIAESPLFREKRDWFRKYFPLFMKYITGGFVGEEEAGLRLFQVAHDPRCSKSGVYWCWNGGPREGRGSEALEKDGQISGSGGAGGGWDSIFENDQSGKVLDVELGFKLFQYATDITGAEWPKLKQVTSPCPTLKVIGAISKSMIEKEELKRMTERPGFNADGSAIQLSKAKKTKAIAQKVVGGVTRNTLGRVARFANKRLLGRLPQEAVTGSYMEEKPLVDSGAASKSVVAATPIEDRSTSVNVQVTPNKVVQEPVASVKVIEDEGSVFNSVDVVVYKSDSQLIEEAISRQVFVINAAETKDSTVAFSNAAETKNSTVAV
jgi:protochlorophyllide reductase